MAKETLTGGKPYVKWNKVGQVIEGTLHKIERSRSSRGGMMAHLVDENGEPFIISAPTLLEELLSENFNRLQGQWLTITFTEQDRAAKAGESGLMRFTVEFDPEVTKAAAKEKDRT